MHRHAALLASLATIAIAGCGGSSSSSGTTSSSSTPPATQPATAAPTTANGSQAITITADASGALKFTQSSLTASAGQAVITFHNPSPVPHNVTIQQGGSTVGSTPTFTSGQKSFGLHLKPGTYTYFCSVPGHEQAGMKGTLTVQ